MLASTNILTENRSYIVLSDALKNHLWIIDLKTIDHDARQNRAHDPEVQNHAENLCDYRYPALNHDDRLFDLAN